MTALNRNRTRLGRRYRPLGLLGKPSPVSGCRRPADLTVAGLCCRGIREYCLLSGSELIRRKNNEAKPFVAYHYAFDGALSEAIMSSR